MNIAARDWLTLSRLLDTALTLPAAERASWIESLGGEHAPLKGVLAELMARQDLVETGSFLATLPKFAPDDGKGKADAKVGDLVGPYRLERALGIGGMGSVWLAERVDGLLKRRVALKLPHLSGVRAGLAERMARERNILAALEHANIARLYEAGVAEDGRPYLALEYVEGEPIDVYCREHRIDIRARVTLAVQVARAVAHAHAHLVVHRDLKPSNILVDAEGRVHLLDFGIAKLLDAPSLGEGLHTQFVGTVLTPVYASPEQLQGAAVSTASDVYSLGVVLYELLAGVRPYKARNSGDALAMAQAILADEPRRPSEAATEAFARRQLRGDLDTILLKALKKAPAERYATVAEFGDDLERYLRGDAVRARPDSFGYRARKFVGRNKIAVGALAAIVASLSAGLGVALWQAQRLRAEQKTSRAEEQFLENVFRANSNDQPDPAKAREATVRDLLANGAKMVDESLKDVPESRLRMLGTLAQMHADLELYDEAVVLGRKRVDLSRSIYGRDDPRVVEPLIDLSLAMSASESNPERGKVLEEATGILDRNHDTTSFLRGKLMGELSSYETETDTAKSLRDADESVRILRNYPPSSDLSESLVLQGWLLGELRRYSEAEPAFQEAISVSQTVYGKVNAHLPRLYGYLAGPQYRQQKFAAAEVSSRRAWELSKTLKGELSGSTLQEEMGYGLMLVATSRIREGLVHTGHASQLIEQVRGPNNSLDTPEILLIHGRSLVQSGHLQEGLPYLTRVTEIYRRYRPGTNYLMEALELQCMGRIAIGDLDTAQSLLKESQALRKSLNDRNTNLNGDVNARVALALARDELDAAQAALGDLYLPGESSKPSAFSAMQASLLRAEVGLARGESAAARDLAMPVYTYVSGSTQRQYLKIYEARSALDAGEALQLLGQHVEAETLLRHAVALHTELYEGADNPLTANALIALADALVDLGRLDEARALESRARGMQAANAQLGPQYQRPLTALQAHLRHANHA
ncbi:MAG TPA: serine/threonine-protein kinase [Steroidobacteraceae bacterium]|nr:serine/threonine-protein kinase [Steroidobacteraceae bacterium]